MALNIGEKIGALAAFVPGVSAISGPVKARVYYNRSNGYPEKTTERPEQTQEIANQHLIVGPYLQKYNNKLWKASLVEMIPGINLIAAIYSFVILRKLSRTREAYDDPEKFQTFLLKKYDIDSSQNSANKNKAINDVLIGLETDPAYKDLTKENKRAVAHQFFGAITGLTEEKLNTDIIKKIVADAVNDQLRKQAENPQTPSTKEEILQKLEDDFKKTLGENGPAEFD